MLQQPTQTRSTKKILFYGDSILIAGLTSKLRQVKGLETTHAVNGEIGDLSGLDMIVIDLRDNKTSQFLPRLSTTPDVLLVGMDAITNTLTVLTDQPHPTYFMQDVLEALKKAM
jgi:hypothetical protein